MNKLENRLVRNISPIKNFITYKESYEAIRSFHKDKFLPSFNIGLTISRMISHLLLADIISVSKLNSTRYNEEKEDNELFLHKLEIYKLMSFEMLNSIAFGPIREHIYLTRESNNFNEISIKKALNIKGWVKFSIKNKRDKTECVVISHAGEGFIFGYGKTQYFLWDFNTNNFKTRK